MYICRSSLMAACGTEVSLVESSSLSLRFHGSFSCARLVRSLSFRSFLNLRLEDAFRYHTHFGCGPF